MPAFTVVWYHSSELQAGCERPSSCWSCSILGSGSELPARDGANSCRQVLPIIALGHLAASRHGKRLGLGTFPYHLWPATPQPKTKFLHGHLNNIKTEEDSLQPKAFAGYLGSAAAWCCPGPAKASCPCQRGPPAANATAGLSPPGPPQHSPTSPEAPSKSR